MKRQGYAPILPGNPNNEDELLGWAHRFASAVRNMGVDVGVLVDGVHDYEQKTGLTSGVAAAFARVRFPGDPFHAAGVVHLTGTVSDGSAVETVATSYTFAATLNSGVWATQVQPMSTAAKAGGTCTISLSLAGSGLDLDLSATITASLTPTSVHLYHKVEPNIWPITFI